MIVNIVDATRYLAISAVGIGIGLMIASIMSLRGEIVRPAPTWVNVVFGLGVMLLMINTAMGAMSRIGEDEITATFWFRWVALIVVNMGLLLLLRSIRRDR